MQVICGSSCLERTRIITSFTDTFKKLYGYEEIDLDMNLLIVDDSEEITDVISYYCDKENIHCTVVNDGKEGLEAIRSSKELDLILLDLAMPSFTGLDIINSLKHEGLLESKNIVIFTASSDNKMIEELKDSGVKGIIMKPLSLDQLEQSHQ